MSCLDVNITILRQSLTSVVSNVSEHLNVHCGDHAQHLKVYCGVVCDINGNYYLEVYPDVVWLTPDMLSGEFNIYSNVNWVINEEPTQEDEHIYETLQNSTMLTNETLLKDTSPTTIKKLGNSTMIMNKYYLIN